MPFFHSTERKALRATMLAHDALPDLTDWFPVTLMGNQIIWRHVAGRFDSPFFGDTLDRQTAQQRQVCLTPIPSPSGTPALTRQLQQLPCLAPAAFIFHVSRCGSTLLSQCLATLPQCIVMSEPPIVDACLRKDWDGSAHDPEARIALLRQMILALGQQRDAHETHVIIKLDCWHIAHLSLLRAAFPDTPCFFLYRDPQAVLASHQRQRGPQMVPGMILPADMDQHAGDAPRSPGDLDSYCVQVMAWMFGLAIAQADHLHWINYSELPDAIWQRFLARLGLHCDAQQLAAMRTRSGFHAKRQVDVFSGDPAPHSVPADTAATSLAQQALGAVVMPLYQQLEQLRRAAIEDQRAG